MLFKFIDYISLEHIPIFLSVVRYSLFDVSIKSFIDYNTPNKFVTDTIPFIQKKKKWRKWQLQYTNA